MQEAFNALPSVSPVSDFSKPPSALHSVRPSSLAWKSEATPSPTPPAGGLTPSTPLPPPTNAAPRPLDERESQLVKHLSRLQFFLATAPTRWMAADGEAVRMDTSLGNSSQTSPHPNLNRFLLPNGEHVACVFWNGLYHITGTDIVRALVFRFEAFSRPVRNMKKFEEGVFSDLRNLKPGTDASLEEPKSPFLDLLFRNGCIRTQKKQKVFYWFSVPHDRLFLDALERDLKREKMGQDTTTLVIGEPARSFRYDPTRSLYEQFAGKQPGIEESVNFTVRCDAPSRHDLTTIPAIEAPICDLSSNEPFSITSAMSVGRDVVGSQSSRSLVLQPESSSDSSVTANSVLFSQSLLKGSPAYKQGRKKNSRDKKHRSRGTNTAASDQDTADEESGSDNEMMILRSEHDAIDQNPMSLLSMTPQTLHPVPAHNTHSAGLLGRAVPTVYLPLPHSEYRMNYVEGSSDFPSQKVSALEPWIGKSEEDFDHPPIFTSDLSAHPNVMMQPTSSLSSVGSDISGPVKGFSCPLLSCGRLFKRLEHLKRHVRTHTQERPYECARCAKRFSRSDNLTQHYKTHEKQDRGERDQSERMRTDVSDGTDEDVSLSLEAQVDAMGEESRSCGGSSGTIAGLGTDDHGAAIADIEHHTLASLPTVKITPSELFSVRPFRGESHALEGTWPELASTYGPVGIDGALPNTVKRHRSMTPNLPLSSRASLAGPPTRLTQASPYQRTVLSYPYSSHSSTASTHSIMRASSLDPSASQSKSYVGENFTGPQTTLHRQSMMPSAPTHGNVESPVAQDMSSYDYVGKGHAGTLDPQGIRQPAEDAGIRPQKGVISQTTGLVDGYWLAGGTKHKF